jgi:diguanylate cyclase (GGDEF)-like protein
VARHLKATRDNDRLDGLFRAAVEVHAPTRLQDVEEALVASSGRLLRTDGVHIGTAPPAAGELGVHLRGDGRDARWLIVPGRNDVERLRVEDQRLLDAVSAIGTAAIEKTALLEQVRRQAFHDALTGLPNQLLLDDRITQALAHAGRTGEHVAVLFLDLDNFKKVNDSLGHAVGNELLCQVARRLQAALREGDSVARMGGDEFTLLLRDVDGPEDALRVGEKLLKALAGHPFTVHRDELFITASIGVAVAPRDGSTPQTLLKNADAAMYRAKDRGKASCHMYASDMNATSYARLALEADLHNAMRREELRVFYQPLIELRTGAIAGVEALVRWQHPDLGLLGPDQFVGIAEQAGLICAVDGWVLQTACRQAQAWVEAGLPPIRVSVNISARHLHDANVVDLVRGALAASGLAPDFLELEVTESVAVQDDGGPLRVLAALRALGVHIAIDDFGMGYSMLGRLRDFPIEKVKIDKSFVQEITDGHSNAPLVAAMVAMGHSLDLTVVAEGVETVAQLSYLADLDCDLGQGYLFSQPITADAVEVLLLDGCSTTIDLTVELDQAS